MNLLMGSVMEGSSLLLANLCFENVKNHSNHNDVIISPSLKHIVLCSDRRKIVVYNITRKSDVNQGGSKLNLIWKDKFSDEISVCFSRDAKNFGVFIKSQLPKVVIYNIAEYTVTKANEVSLSDPLQSVNITSRASGDIWGSTDAAKEVNTLVYIQKNNVVLYSSGTIQSFNITNNRECVQNYVINLESSNNIFHFNAHFFYYLNSSGTLYIYQLEDGSLTGVFDVDRVLPKNLHFTKIYVNTLGNRLAIVSRSNEIYILDISDVKVPQSFSSHEQLSAKDSSSSVSSFKTSISKISSRSYGANSSVATRKIASIANATSAISYWGSYLEKLRNTNRYSNVSGTEEESSSFVCISDITNNFSIRNVHFIQDSIGVWASSMDQSSEGLYRVYDVLSGRLESADILAPDAQMVCLDTSSVSVDLLLQGPKLSLLLGVVSRETLFQKMVRGNDLEKVSQEIMTLPVLQEGLANHELDRVRMALNIFTQGFKSKLSKEYDVDQLIDSTKQLFETTISAVKEDQWSMQVCRLAVIHANTLLSLLPSPTPQDPLLIEILNYIALLRRRDSAVSVDLPNIFEWAPWLPLSDGEVVLKGITVSLPLVQCFLAIHRGWTDDDIHGKRFYSLLQDVVTKLLKQKKLDQASNLLSKVNLVPEQEFLALCLRCRDSELRNFLIDSLSNSLTPEHSTAWQFLSLVESVLVDHCDRFPNFGDSPLTISDVLLLTEKEKKQLLADLYFNTGEAKLKVHLEKDICWEYLLEHNSSEGILAWLSLQPSDSGFDWPLELFSQWKVDQTMVDNVLTADCSDLTRHIVFKKLATFGIYPHTDLQNPRSLVLRMANAQIYPDENEVLNQENANLSLPQFNEIMLKHAVKKNLVEVVVKSDLEGISLDANDCPDWLKVFKIHRLAGKTLNHSDILEAVESASRFLASFESLDQTNYLKQHPLVAVVLDLLKNQNVCELHSHVSPLLAAALPVDPPTQDIDLYSVLAHTVPFHTDNIFKYQLSNKRNTPMPDFTNEKLNLRYGITFSLGFKEFLKQGRPASAFSFIMQKGRTFVSKRAAVRSAHGLALCHAEDVVVTTACVAFVELLGKSSSLLRTHVAVARVLIGHLSEKTLKEHLYNLVQGKTGTAGQLLAELENQLLAKWKGTCPSVVSCLQDFHLAVRFSVCHKLPPPTSLLVYSLETSNWLLFILTAQLFQYPLAEVQKVCSLNGKHVISEHLYHSLHNTSRSQSEDKETKTFESDTNLFACLAQFGNDADKLFVLSRQHHSPALALLASTLQPHPVEVGMCWWLVASLPSEESLQYLDAPWSPDSVTGLLEHVVKLGYIRTLAHAFTIFQPKNPLSALSNFLVDSVVEHKFKESILNLKFCLAVFSNLSNKTHQESSFLMTRSWVAVTAYRVACTAFACCFPSGYFRHCFLKTLCEVQFSETLQADQSLPLYLRLSECLMSTQLQLDWKSLCLDEDLSQLAQTLHSLTEQHMFDTAFKFALIAGLPCDNILVTQWSVLASTTESKGRDFWMRCEAAFQQASIDPEIAVNFYQREAANSDDLQERFVLLKFALGWMLKTSAEPDTITQLQTELYSTCLQDKFKTEVITEGITPVSLRCLSDDLVTSQVHSSPKLTSSQCHQLDSIIHQLLVVGDIRTAFILQSIFHHVNQDCELLLACMRLAEGVWSVNQLPSRIQEYLADETVRRPRMTFSSPMPKMRSKSNLLQSDSQRLLNTLYALQANQTCATTLFTNIINAFKVSLALSCNYKEIILDNNPLNLLQVGHDFEVATGLLNLASLTRYECTQYVCSQIVNVISKEPEDGKYMLWSCDLDTELPCLLELSGSALLLGNLLLASDPLASSHPSTYRQGVELLVLAHNCFTKVCHMEGISSVLNLSRSLTSRLLNCHQWPLLVRLLTGVSRYTEMSYIFQILKDNDQFEFLLGKGLDKHPQLMAATLEFVRHDKELFSLVAHHFSMYSELAALYEGEARAELSRVEVSEAGVAVNTHNKACLQTVMSKYSDATEHYMQAKKMKCGVASVQQAELIAVQLSLLNNTSESHVPCLINLSQEQAVSLVNTVLSCEQAHIVESAYNILVDWSAALYHNCVVKGDSTYLNSWTRHHELTKTVVQDVVRRFQSEKDMSSALESNMRWFVSSVSLLDVKYRVASQLGFRDILHQLLSSPDMAYLKDTVWQSGFKSQLL